MSSRNYLLNELNWKTAQQTKYEVAILPWGSTEPHNYHLPYSSDTIQSQYIAEESTRKAWEKGAKIIVLPTIPIGVNSGHLNLNMTLNINPSTQLAILRDILYSIQRHGIKKFLVINGHGGNDFKPIFRELKLEFEKMFIGLINWYKADEGYNFFDEPGEHGGEMETSNLLLIKPELVLPLTQAGDGNEKKSKIKGLREGWVWTPRNWDKISIDTGLGNPKKAAKEKGEAYLNSLTEQIGEFIFELADTKVDEIY
jgi:creatinine amidohydrolase